MKNNSQWILFEEWRGALFMLVTVFTVSYAQALRVFSFGGVNPDLAPVALLVFSFFKVNIYAFFAALLLVFFLFTSSFWWCDMTMLALALFVVITVKLFFLRRGLARVLLSTILFTLIFYIFTRRFYLWQDLQPLVLELLLNCLFASLLFYIFSVLDR